MILAGNFYLNKKLGQNNLEISSERIIGKISNSKIHFFGGNLKTRDQNGNSKKPVGRTILSRKTIFSENGMLKEFDDSDL